MRSISPTAMKGIKEGGRRLREKSIGTGLGRTREARKRSAQSRTGKVWDMMLPCCSSIEHLDGRGRRPSGSSRPQVWKSVFSRNSTRQHVDKSLYQYGRCQTNDFRSKSGPRASPSRRPACGPWRVARRTMSTGGSVDRPAAWAQAPH
jgi:hypothetical protein